MVINLILSQSQTLTPYFLLPWLSIKLTCLPWVLPRSVRDGVSTEEKGFDRVLAGPSYHTHHRGGYKRECCTDGITTSSENRNTRRKSCLSAKHSHHNIHIQCNEKTVRLRGVNPACNRQDYGTAKVVRSQEFETRKLKHGSVPACFC